MLRGILDELELRSLLLFALLSGGGNANQLPTAAVRCYEVADRVPDVPRAVPSLWRIALYCTHANRERALRTGERLLKYAREVGNVGQMVALLAITANCMILEARYDEARERAEETLRLYDAELHRQNAHLYGIDSKVHGHILLALLLEIRGDPEGAAVEAEAGVAWAKFIDHPLSLGNALIHLGCAHQAVNDWERVKAITANAMELASRHSLDFVRIFCGILRGWAEHSPSDVDHWLTATRATGLQGGLTYWLGVAAETHSASGDFEVALDRVDEALQRVTKTGELYQLPELLRHKATYLSRTLPATSDRPPKLLRQAIELARQHGAKSSELRSNALLERMQRPSGSEEIASRPDCGATLVRDKEVSDAVC
ncbi:MAG: hypothetical protein QM784_09575 [Polyangiaceae bacterium]